MFEIIVQSDVLSRKKLFEIFFSDTIAVLEVFFLSLHLHVFKPFVLPLVRTKLTRDNVEVILKRSEKQSTEGGGREKKFPN